MLRNREKVINMKKGKKQAKRRNANVTMAFGIREKIVLCFLVPVLFMIVLGIISYRKAAGRNEQFLSRFHAADDRDGVAEYRYEQLVHQCRGIKIRGGFGSWKVFCGVTTMIRRPSGR